ncbi:MAG: branched-chain amino acid ABC transporter permease [Chloroflexi bacterium]|nr:branched-chain amino acid ABC transporter permease [Chloroflexota bacterium]
MPRLNPVRVIALAMGILFVILPFAAESFIVKTVTEVLIFGIFAMSLDLLVGYTGLVSFGHAAFFGIGAYAAGYLALNLSPNLLITMPLALLVVAGAAVVIGFFSIRVSGVYFLMLTLAFSQMVYAIADRWTDVTGGSNGLAGIPRPRVEVLAFQLVFEDATARYFLVLAVFLLAYAALRWIVRSQFGHALVGIRENETRLRAVGYNTTRFKLTAFVIAGVFAGIAGVLYAGFNRFVSTNELYWTASGQVLIMVIIGGAGTLVGPALGAAFILILQNIVSSSTDRWPTIMGLIFIFFVFAARHGVMGLVRGWAADGRVRIGRPQKAESNGPSAS